MKKISLVLSPIILLTLAGCQVIFPETSKSETISSNEVSSTSSSEEETTTSSESILSSEEKSSEESSESSEESSSSEVKTSEEESSVSSSSAKSSEEVSSESSEVQSSSSSESSEEEAEHPVIIDSEDYLEFWNSSTSLSINITMSQEAAEFINTYQSNHGDSTYHDYYVPCTVTFIINGKFETMEEVGIREKGNLSRSQMLEDGNFSLNTLAHYKLSFKETFDDIEYTTIPALQAFKKTWIDSAKKKERKNRRLFDMEKIDIKWNRNYDETKSKQAYAYKLFRDQGVMAPHDTLANVTLGINGKSSIKTTYEVIECIDSVFVKRHFSEDKADGDLYKCTYSSSPANLSPSYTVGNQIGVEDNTTNYHPSYDLKTNKKKNTTHTNLLHFIEVTNDTTSSAAVFKAKLETVLDVSSFMMFEAVSYLLGNFDDMRNNANNYYLYFESGTNIAHFIPYDFDRCLGTGCDGGNNHYNDYMTNFSPESTKMQCTGSWQTINLYWRTICSSSDSNSGHNNVERVEEYRALYQKNIEDIINTTRLSNKSFNDFVNSFPSSYRGNPNGTGGDNITFASYLEKKIAAIKNCNDQGLINYDIKV